MHKNTRTFKFEVKRGLDHFVFYSGHTAPVRQRLSGLRLALATLCILTAGSVAWSQATNTWTGSESNFNWNISAHWSLGLVPTAAHDVVIPNGVTTFVIVNTNAVCNTFTMEGGNQDNTVIITGSNSLTVSGTITINSGTETGGQGNDKEIAVGSGTLTCGNIIMSTTTDNVIENKITITTGSVIVTGDITMNSPGPRNAITFSSSGSLAIGGSITGGAIVTSTGSVSYTGSSAQTISDYSYYNLSFSGTGGKSLSEDCMISGNFLIDTGATLTLNGYDLAINASSDRSATINGRINVNGDGRLTEMQGGIKTLAIGPSGYLSITDNSGSTLPSFDVFDFNATSVVDYGSTGNQTIENSATYGHLVTSGSNTKTFEGTGGTINIIGTITIENGSTLASNDNTINVGGDWINNGAFTEGTGTVVCNGAAQQLFDGANTTTFYNLVINNSNAGILLSKEVTVSGTLTLTDGIVETGVHNLVISPSTPASVSGGSTASFVYGNLRRTINSGANTYVYPVGFGTKYSPATIAFTAGTLSGSLTSSTVNQDHPQITSSTLDANGSVNRFWIFTVNSGLSTANYSATFHWVAEDEDAGFDYLTSSVGKYNGSSWSYPSIGTRTNTSVEIITESGFSDFQISSCVAPAIDTQPVNKTVCEGSSATLEVTATGPGTISYQWYSTGEGILTNGGNISGATTDALTIDPVSTVDAGSYYVVVSRDCGSEVISVEASLTVLNTVDYGAVSSGNETICSGGDPSNITLSTAPSGGTGSFIYQWYYKEGLVSCPTGTSTSGWTAMSSATDNMFDPASGLSGSRTYAVQIDPLGSPDCGEAMWASGCRQVTVNDVSSGVVSNDQTICSGDDPAAFTVSEAGTGSGTLTYQWQSSTTDCVDGFSDISGATNDVYDVPSGLTETTHYKRKVISTLNGVLCEALSNCLTVTVNHVSPGVVTDNQTLCSGEDPAAFSTTDPATGSGILTYQWQSNTTDCVNGYGNISGATNETYDPPAGLTETTYFRRIVTSTLSGVTCNAAGNCVEVTINDVEGGVIENAQTICFGEDPAAFTVSTASTGSGVLTYQWQMSSTDCGNGYADISGATNDTYDPPGGLVDTTCYRRITTSTLNGVLCTSISNSLILIVKAVVDLGTIANGDESICEGGDPSIIDLSLQPTGGAGSFDYQWYYQDGIVDCPSDTSTSGWTPIIAATGSSYDPPSGLTGSRTYAVLIDPTGIPDCGVPAWANGCRQVVVYGNTITSGTVNGSDVNSQCDGGNPDPFSVGLPSGGDGNYTYLWEQSNDCTGAWVDAVAEDAIINTLNFDPPALSLPTQLICFRLKVTDGCGNVVYSTVKSYENSFDPVSPTIYPTPPSGTTVCLGSSVSATFTSGSGGTGTISETFEFTTNGGLTWTAYSAGNPIVASSELIGIDMIQIRTMRTATGIGCDDAEYHLVQWSVDPIAPDIATCPVPRNIIGCDLDVITQPSYSNDPAPSTLAEFSNGSNQGIVNDNCGITTITYQDAESGLCPLVVIRTWTVQDSAGNMTTCTQVITVTAPDVQFVCAEDQIVAGCQTQGAIDTAFTAWLATTTASGGCNAVLSNNATGAPLDCGGNVLVTWTYTSSCAPFITECTRTFTVMSAPDIEFTCAEDQTESACQTQGAIDTAFALWLETTTASGGCNGVLSNDATVAPPACGGNASVTWTYASSCAPFITECTRIFTVTSAPDIEFTCAGDQTEAACQTQGAIDTAFALWLEITTVSGGCNGVLTNDAAGAPQACGGSTSVTWTYASSCAPFITECTRTFTVTSAPDIEFVCAEDQTEAACQTQGAIDTAFALWLETTTAGGGCNGVLTNDGAGAPQACGGSTSVTWTYTSSCAPFITECTKIFTVTSAPDIDFICAESQTEASCQTQGAIDTAFALWLETTTASGGCNGVLTNDATEAPQACGGSTSVTWTYASSCAPFVTECTKTFTVTSAPDIEFICAEDQTEASCQTQGAIDTAFALWLETTTASGGCNGVLTHDETTAPSACGGSTSVTWTFASVCAPFITECTKIFTITSSPDIEFTCAEDQTESACQTQGAIDTAFALWLETTSASGGCNGVLSNNATAAPPACGGSTSVTWTYTSNCAPFITECTKIFTVVSAPSIEFICAEDQTESACQTQGAIDTAFALWLETTTASGGCNGMLSHDGTSAPTACGGSATVTWIYTSSCTPFTTECTRIFTVATPETEFICAEDLTVEACQTQGDIDTAFALWLETTTVSAGCEGALSNNSTGPPPACGGNTTVTWTYTSDCPPYITQCTKTFTVSPAPNLMFNCASHLTVPACQTQGAIDTAFALWLETTTASGGCNGILSDDATVAPPACGGSAIVTWVYNSDCTPFAPECTRTFTVAMAPALVFMCATDQTESACQTQGAIDTAFALWLETVSVNGGCNGVLSNNAGVAPSACGGSASVTWTYTSSCAPTITECTKIFTVTSAPAVEFTCAEDQTEASCQTQGAIDTAFALWLESTSASGGCNGVLSNNATVAPLACGGSASVTWTYTSSCAPTITECTKIFTVTSAPAVEFICAEDQTEASCQTQGAIDTAFALWLDATTASGGCNGILINDATAAPSTCGGNATVTWTYTNSCAPFITECTRTFTVVSAPDVEFTCAEDQTEASCQTQGAIDTAFALWLETTTASGGCNGMLTHDGTTAPSACGGSTVVTWTYTSSCAPFITECTKIFTVTSAPAVEFMCAEDQTEGSCQTQGAIDTAFALWLETTTASGGCNGVLSNDATVAPPACGGNASVTWTYTSSCAPFITECTKIFTVTSAPAVEIICAEDQTETSCQTQGAIDTAFTAWLATTTASGGCDAVLSNNATVAPSACGGSTMVTWTYTSSCSPYITQCTRTFVVTSAPDIEFTCAEDQTEASCQTQGAIDTAFTAWLATTTASGGCDTVLSNNATVAPSACGGSTMVTWTYTSSCAPFITECTRTFTVTSSPDIEFVCADDQTETACQTQGAIDTAFALWLETTTTSGGCNGVLSHDGTTAPSACGGSTAVIWTYTSSCAPFITECTRTFTVTSAPDIEFTCAENQTELACQTQGAIDTAFALWLETTTASGGCNGVLTNNVTGAPSACGGSTSVTWTYTSSCAPFITECTRTFTVTSAPDVEFICAEDQTESACQTQGAIDTAFALWLETTTASGGCNGVLSHDGTTAPSACGGSTSVTWTYTSSCAPFITGCTRTFTVTSAPDVEFTCAEDQTEASCQTQGAIDTAFALWLETTTASGGCNGVLSHDGTTAPSACGGSTSVTWTFASGCAPFITECTRTFTVTSAPAIEFICAEDQTEASCQTQGAINTAFALWLETTMASGGCNSLLSNNATVAPSSSGGSTIVTWTYTSGCAPFITECTRTFTVTSAPAVEFICAEDQTEESCQTQGAIDTAFTLWLETTTASGGCDGILTNSATGAPAACGGNVIVTWTYTSSTAPFITECTRTFSVHSAPVIDIICARNQSEASCQTQGAIDTAFALWLEATTASGGCNGALSNNATGTPSACGGSTIVTWTYTTSCAPFITECSDTFTVDNAPEILVSCPEDVTFAACATQGEIDNAFFFWALELEESITGGCALNVTYEVNGEEVDPIDLEVPDNCVGGSITVIVNYTDLCTIGSCASTFNVIPATAIEMDCPADVTISSCSSQEEIDSSFTSWIVALDTAISGGCTTEITYTLNGNTVLDLNNINPPDKCAGGILVISCNYSTMCESGNCVSTFSVPANQPPVLSNTPVNQSYTTLPTGCQRTIPILKPGIIDDCDSNPTLSVDSDDPNVVFFDFGAFWQADYEVGVTTITITGTDLCGNETVYVFTITITDIFVPTITGCPANITIANDVSQCGAIVSWTAPTASDNCPGVVLVSSHNPGEFFPAGVTAVAYTATDVSGLVSTCMFNITVNDTEAPVFDCNSLETIYLTAYALSCENDTVVDIPSAEDICDGAIAATGVRSDSMPAGAPWSAGTMTTITWTFADNANNTTTCVQDVTVSACEWPSVYIYVDSSKVSGAQTGINWANAVLRLEDAITLAETYPNVEEIWVAGGTYYPSPGVDRTSAFTIPGNIKIYGGFAGIIENISDRNIGTYPTILSGDIGIPNDNSDNCYHVIKVNPAIQNAIVDGFFIKQGNADGTAGLQNVGGGLLIQGELTLVGCQISDNHASNTGSAVFSTGSGAALVLNDVLINNNTAGDGKHIRFINSAQLMMLGVNQIQN